MNFVADEGIDALIVKQLRQVGHQVWYVAELAPSISDEEVLDLANQEEAVLLTFDKDFGDLVYRQRRISRGVMLIRLHGLPSSRKAELVLMIINQYEADLVNAFTVLTPTKIRIRPQRH